MLRTEFVVLGCILVLVGIGICVFGYQKTQPTLADAAVGLLEQLSQRKAPQDLKSDKTGGYVLMGVGGVVFVVGVGLILSSRTTPS